MQVCLFAGVIFAALSLTACGDSCKTPKAPPSYANDGIATIVHDNCLPCHTNRGKQKVQVPDNTFYNDYSGILAEAKSAEEKVSTGDMPPTTETPLSAEDKEKFDQWVLCGAAP